MAEYTRQLVKQNGYDEVVTVLQGRAEEIELPEQVDVLVSEWMGNCLLVIITLPVLLLLKKIHCCGTSFSALTHVQVLLYHIASFFFFAFSPRSSLSSWWSQFCWPGTAGLEMVARCGPPLRPSPLCHVRPTAITPRKWPSGSGHMASTSLLFSKSH